MPVTVLNRMVVTIGISAVVLFGLGVPARAQPPPQHGHERQDGKKDTKEQKAQKKQEQQPGRVAPHDQQTLIRQQQQRLAEYREHLDQQQRVAEQQSAQLERQHRRAQYRLQQHYLARLHQQQLRIQSQADYDYNRDPYFSTPPSYRYFRGDRYYETNQYGVDLLRQAVNYGYDEGFRTGLADRQDRWASDYEDSFAYRDANYGYGGFYLDRDDYNSYFREGFRRGYDDGYDNRSQYGRYTNGRGTILDAVLATILNFQAIR